MKKTEEKMASLGYRKCAHNLWKNGNRIVQVVNSSEFQKNAIRIIWREGWKEYYAVVYDYSLVKGPVCIVPTKVLFNSSWVDKKRKMDSYANSGYWWSSTFPLEHELPRLILDYENKWEILGEKVLGKNKNEHDVTLASFSDKELLRLYCNLMEELRHRNIIRSSNNPVSDYAEKIVAERMNLTLAEGSNKGYDAIEKESGLRYQIKSRRLTKHNNSKQLGVIRHLDQKLFDYLIAVIFNESLEPEEIWQVPSDIISKYSKFSQHQNGHILILTGKILQDEEVKRLL